MSRTLGLCLLVLLGAALLRIVPLPHEAVWVDELYTRHVLRQSPSEALQVIRHDLTHPPLYYYVERPFYALLGDSPYGLRALSLLCGLLLVAAVARFTLELTHGETYAALSAAALVAVSDLQVTQAQNARSYALYALEILAIAWAFYRMTQDPSRAGPKVAYAVLGVLAVLTHYVASLFLFALAPAALLSPQRRRLVRDWFLLSLPAALALLSWGLYVLPIYRAKHGLGQLAWIPRQDWSSAKAMGAELFGRPVVEHGIRASILSAAVLLGVGVWIWRRRPACRLSLSPAAMALVMGLAVIPAAILFAAGWVTRGSFWVDRHLLPSQAFVAIGAGMCLALVARYRPTLAHLALAGLIVLNDPLRLIGPPLPRNVPYDKVAAELRALRAPGEPIVATWAGIPWPVNYYLADPDSVQLLVIGRNTPATAPAIGGGWAASPYRNFIGGRPRVALAPKVWLLHQPTDNAVADSLTGQGWRVRSTRRFAGVHLDELGRP
jgi:hypothetical protein